MFNAMNAGKVDARLVVVNVAATLNLDRVVGSWLSAWAGHPCPPRRGRPAIGGARKAQRWSSWGSTTSGSDSEPSTRTPGEAAWRWRSVTAPWLPTAVTLRCMSATSSELTGCHQVRPGIRGESVGSSSGTGVQAGPLRRLVRRGRWTEGRRGRGPTWSAAGGNRPGEGI